MSEITVVGSINLDLVVRTGHIPGPGETVLGGDLTRIPGGKGANQAVAAARLGRRVTMIGRVGDDEAADQLLAALAHDGVDVDAVHRIPHVPSGVALITVDETGDNAIVVAPGANARLTAGDVRLPAVAHAAVVLLQLEIPTEAVVAAAHHAGGVVVLNPAPAPPGGGLSPDLLAAVDVLVPNESEVARLTGVEVGDDLSSVAAAARSLGVGSAVVTLGARGALVVEPARHLHLPAPRVTPVDTTAAGDSFCAGLADALAGGHSLAEATRWAVRVGAATTLRSGAQSSLPTRAEVERLTPS